MDSALLPLIAGLLVLTFGAEFLVQAASSIARRAGLSPLLIGLTVVSIGTSLPELMVSLDAAFQGSGAIGLGNVVGSNIANIALILGLAALVRPLRVKAQVIRIDGPILVAVSILLVLLLRDATISRVDGILLSAGVVTYILFNIQAASRESHGVQTEFDREIPGRHALYLDVFLLAIGIGGLFLGADLLIRGAVQVARDLRIPQIVVGLTVVAVGTSLPELATSVVAAYRQNGDIAIGNALGSSIFNILGILGITATVQPVSAASLQAVELLVMTGVAVLALPFLRSDYILSRTEGGILLISYLSYLAYLFLR